MKDIKKYQGVIPAFYACYDAEGNISVEGVKALTRHDETKNVVFIFVSLDLGSHFVCGFPDFIGKLLFVHNCCSFVELCYSLSNRRFR